EQQCTQCVPGRASVRDAQTTTWKRFTERTSISSPGEIASTKRGTRAIRDGSGRHGDGQISLCVLMWDTVGGGGSAHHAIGAMLTVGQNRQLRLVLQPIRPAQSAEAAGSTKNRSGTGESYSRKALAKALGEYDGKGALAQHEVGPSNYHNKRDIKLNE